MNSGRQGGNPSFVMVRCARSRPLSALVGLLWVAFVVVAMPSRDLPGWVCVLAEDVCSTPVSCCESEGRPAAGATDCCGTQGEPAAPRRVICCEFGQGPAIPPAPAPRIPPAAPLGDLLPPPAPVQPEARLPRTIRLEGVGTTPAFLDACAWIPFVGRAPPSLA